MASSVRYFFCAAMVLSAEPAWAPVMAIFPGLADQVSNSRHIVIATVLTDATPKPMDVFAPQRVRVLTALKGALEPQVEITVELRGGLLWPFATDLAIAEYRPSERYVLFMAGDSSSTRHTLLNTQGSAFWIPREIDLSGLPPGDVRSQIEFLVKEVIAYGQQRSEELERRAEAYIRN